MAALRNTKWTFTVLYLTAAVAAAAVAFLAPAASGAPPDARWLYAYGLVAAVAFLAMRFKRSLGALVVVLLVALAATLVALYTSIAAFTGEHELASVLVLDSGDRADSMMQLEVAIGDAEPAIIELAGTHFAPVVKVVIFDDALVVLGLRTWYRFEGVVGFDVASSSAGFAVTQTGPLAPLGAGSGLPDRVWWFLEANDQRLWGVKSAQIELDLKRARQLQRYSVRIQNDGGVQIVEQQPISQR